MAPSSWRWPRVLSERLSRRLKHGLVQVAQVADELRGQLVPSTDTPSTPPGSSRNSVTDALAVIPGISRLKDLRSGQLPLAAGLMAELLQRHLPTSQTVATILPSLLKHEDPQVLPYFQAAVIAVLAQDVDAGPLFSRTLAEQLALVPPAEQRRYLARVLRGAYVDPGLALVLAEQLPQLLSTFSEDALDSFLRRGFTLWRERSDKAISFFRLESRLARSALDSLRQSLPLASVRRTLQLYAQAHGGEQVRVKSLLELPAQQRPSDRTSAFTDGQTLYLPHEVSSFPTQEENFRLLKAMTAIEAGRIEFGTFALGRSSEAPGGARNAGAGALLAALAEMPSPEVARALFMLLETHRVEQRVRLEYPGLRADLQRLTEEGLHSRPAPLELAPIPALLEALAWRLWGRTLPHAPLTSLVPEAIRPALSALEPLATALAQRDATVETSLAQTRLGLKTLASFGLIAGEPEAEPPDPDNQEQEQAAENSPEDAEGSEEEDEGEGEGGEASMPAGAARTRDEGGRRGRPGASQEAPLFEPLPHQGQLWLELAAELQADAEDALSEAMAALEADKPSTDGGVPPDASPSELAHDASFATPLEGRGEPGEALGPLPERPAGSRGTPSDTGARFFYPEWDHHIEDYKDHWCQVVEEGLPEGSRTFADDALSTHGALVKSLRRQFQHIRREEFQKLRRQMDGDEIDVEAAVEALIDRKGRRPPSDRVYIQRHKQVRDVAVAFLVDMSSSTQQVVQASGRTILDVEKESLLLMAEALDSLGDAYAIYGFSGYGRGRVSFYVAKDFEESSSSAVKSRISGMSGRLENRDGAAIRHAVHKLQAWPAKVRLLILLSDGRPLDCGCRQYFERYAQEDTRMALLEARHAQVHPFCITVDRQAQRYLSRMYGQVHYTIIDQVSALPYRLPNIYRRLTT